MFRVNDPPSGIRIKNKTPNAHINSATRTMGSAFQVTRQNNEERIQSLRHTESNEESVWKPIMEKSI